MSKAIGYLRVSTAAQADSMLGLEAQRKSIEVAAKRLHLDGLKFFQDAGVSGATGIEKRPGLMAAVEELGRGDVLLISSRDRLGRDPIEVAIIERQIHRDGAKVLSADGKSSDDDDPASVFMRRIIDATAEYERRLISQRTKAALAAKKARGELCGGVPFGVDVEVDGKTLVANPKEQEAIEVMISLRGDGASLRAIAKSLEDGGFRTKSGGASWAAVTVGRILKRVS